MLSIQRIGDINNNYKLEQKNKTAPVSYGNSYNKSIHEKCININSENLKSYHPSFINFGSNNISNNKKIDNIKSNLDSESIKIFKKLQVSGLLENNNSNDGSTVLDNLYKIATEPRIIGLDKKLILKEVIKAIDNPYGITQKFGDIPDRAADEISSELGDKIPESAKHVISSSCVAASMEFNLADKYPAEFARFAAGLTSENYCVDKHVKMSDFSENFADGLWKLKEFKTNNKLNNNWDDIDIKIQPDRNAIVRARVQTSYKDKGERSCVDVLIQSAILNFASQNSYNTITDERTGKYNPDKTGLTDFEKNFAEQVIFQTPKLSVVYQNLDENGYLIGYNSTLDETKQHILKSLELGQNVIIGYTHLDKNNIVQGGHEITIVGYEKDKKGKGNFICNDTDDDIDEPIKISEEKLLPLIHHAGIPKEALSDKDIIVEPWREYLKEIKDGKTKHQI